jgi:HSP20 family molecular chaperone IbpA
MDNQTSAVAQRDSRGASAQQPQAHGRAVATDAAIRAPVDVFEDSEGLTLEADMPGVSKDRLTVRIDGDTLVLEGKVQFDLPEQSEALYADVRSSTYRRNFVLSRELDTSNIQAQLKDGVLKVRIPKRAELRPRKIEVQGG